MPERCACCGEIIPEGRQVCPICERKIVGCKNCRNAAWTDELFVVINPRGVRVETQFNFCPTCGRKLPKPRQEVDNGAN